MSWHSKNKTRKRAITSGFRSGFESKVSDFLKLEKIEYSYEPKDDKITYIKPATNRTYLPDFVCEKKSGGKMYIESKGRWTTVDRQKMKLIAEQNPTLDIRMLFQNPNAKIRKGSTTTYGDFADKLGLTWAKGPTLPISWVKEIK